MALALRWRTVPVEALSLSHLDGDLVVRNAMTGNTHLLEHPAAGLLAALMEAGEGMTADELAARMGRAASIDAVEALLADFQRLGLAEPAG
jgi:PqqD family protein of HPr-rel-A system